MKKYLDEFDTGALSPAINCALFYLGLLLSGATIFYKIFS